MKILSQRDSKWAGKLLGFNTATYTIGSHGCLITCQSMFLETTPDLVNEALKKVSGFVSGGFYVYGSLQKAYKQVLSEKVVSTPSALTDAQVKEIQQALDSGGYVMCGVDANPATQAYDQHFVLLKSYVGENFRILDPWTGTERPIDDYLGLYSKTFRQAIYQYIIYKLQPTPATPAPVCDCTALEKELDDMRTSRDKWKAKYEELDSSSTADIIAKSKHIEELQKTIAEQNSQLTLNTGAQDSYAKDVEALKKDVATSNQNAQVLKEQNEALTKENSHLSDLLKSLQDKEVGNMTNAKKDYSQYKILAWRYLRVFMSTFLVSLASGLVGASDITAIKALVIAGIAAGITALAKNFRDQVSDGDVTNLVNKLPL